MTDGQWARWQWRDIVDARLCLRRRHRIQPPHGEIQRGGERNPRKVGHEQQRGDDVDRIEKHDGRYDGHPDQNNVDEGEIGGCRPKKRGDHAALRMSCNAYTAKGKPAPAKPAFRQISHPATAIIRYRTVHTGAKSRFGGRQDGFFNCSYQSPGRNNAPCSAARKQAAMKQASPMIEAMSI